LLDGCGFEFCTVASDFLDHGKLLGICLVYQVYLYGFFSIAHTYNYELHGKIINKLFGSISAFIFGWEMKVRLRNLKKYCEHNNVT
ncbi:hypothetical protein, partial [Psychrobacter sp.]|uniref:hypothetical protein n=1 Tax=Psychrobacter sp. TaxID=56811 RepID=UPI003BB174B5